MRLTWAIDRCKNFDIESITITLADVGTFEKLEKTPKNGPF